jgi:hypothetical protein
VTRLVESGSVSTNLLVPTEDACRICADRFLITGTIQQFWRDVLWGKLDVLMVDHSSWYF